jgi:hypothetical protein
MKKAGCILLMAVLGASQASASVPTGSSPRFDIGGGMEVGGFFGDTSRDWRPGMGGLVFAQVPWKHNLEARLLAGMVWNDGSNSAVQTADVADFGAQAGDRPYSFRRTNLEATLLWRVEPFAIHEYGVPYLGMGIGTYERRPEYRSAPDLTSPRRVTGDWDGGFHGLAGLRFFRTSGLFIGLEGGCRWIDTPGKWTSAYDVSFLLGVQLGI